MTQPQTSRSNDLTAKEFRRSEPDSEEEGQIILALLLVVVVLIFFGLLFAQVGSAADQKTQTQTAADSGAVAGAHRLRDAAIVQSSRVIPYSFVDIFSTVPVPDLLLSSTACDAVQRNWNANPHGGAGINCSQNVLVNATTGSVKVAFIAPADQVVKGPAEVSAERAQASATARVSFTRCSTLTGAQKAITDWLINATLTSAGSPGGNCFSPDDEVMLKKLDKDPEAAAIAIGPPGRILKAVQAGTRVELVN